VDTRIAVGDQQRESVLVPGPLVDEIDVEPLTTPLANIIKSPTLSPSKFIKSISVQLLVCTLC
jgi:hypothetical protein